VALWWAAALVLLFIAGGGTQHVYGQNLQVANQPNEGLSVRPGMPKDGDILQLNLTSRQADLVQGMLTLKPNETSIYVNSDYVVMNTLTFQVMTQKVVQMTRLLEAMQAELAKPPDVVCKKGEGV
jgi:hypothetical protein